MKLRNQMLRNRGGEQVRKTRTHISCVSTISQHYAPVPENAVLSVLSQEYSKPHLSLALS